MKRPPAVRRVCLELGLGDRGRLGDRPREILAEPDDSRPLFLVDCLEPFGIVFQARLERLDQRALVLRDLLEPRRRGRVARDRDPGATTRAAARPGPAPWRMPRRARGAAAPRSPRGRSASSRRVGAPPRRRRTANRRARGRAFVRGRRFGFAFRSRPPPRAAPSHARTRDPAPGCGPCRGGGRARRRPRARTR